MNHTGSIQADIREVKKLIQAGQFQSALDSIKPLLDENAPAELYYLASVNSRYLHNLQDAQSYIEKTIQKQPDHARAWQEQGHIHRANNDFSQAESGYQNAVRLNPALMASWQNLLNVSQRQEVLDVASRNIDYLTNLPEVLRTVLGLIHDNRLEMAEKLSREFMKRYPTHAEGMRLLASIAEKNSVLDDAEFLLESVLLEHPANLWARYDYVQVLHRRQKYHQAYEAALKLVELLPDDFSALFTLANQTTAVGKHDEAIAIYERLKTKEPSNPAVPMVAGHVYKTVGDAEQAISHYKQALRLSPTLGDAYWSLANMKTFGFDAELVEQMNQLLDQPLEIADKTHIHFALGKAYEDADEYERSFKHYHAGNELKKRQRDYRLDFVLDEMQRQTTCFSQAFVNTISSTSDAAVTPIFIVGLPRAGSTLVEQILSSHSQVEGTMELPNIIAYVQELAGRVKKQEGSRYPECLAELSEPECQAFGERFLEETKVHREGLPYFIDKMPNNFRHIGFIKMILPQAIIIDARRDPMSCCFSAYKQCFAEGQEYSYDLTELADYYHGYTELMDFWQSCFPNDIYRVQYETMVEETETQIKSLIDFVGLPMEEACLNFHATKRAVRTASAEQVRQPIYKKSLAPWQPFEAWLSPLSERLNQN